MAYNGSGAFTIDTAGNPVSSGTTIDPAVHNATNTEIATGLTTAITKDGQTTITQNIPFNNKKITGLGAGTARTDGASLATIQDGTGVYVATVGGTADVITLTPSPAITAYAAGQTFRFIASGANTTNVTVDISGFGPKAITKNGTAALVAGDIPSGMMVEITYDGTRFILGTIGLAYLPITGGTLTGDLKFTDATYDIGKTGATRPRDLFLSRNAVVTGTLDVTGTTTLAALTFTGALTTQAGVIGTVALGKHIEGLTYANNAGDATNDIDVAVGSATSTHATPASRVLLSLTTALTKRLDASWVTGTNQGGLSSSLTISNVDYYIHLIRVAGVDDVGFDTSETAANLITDHSATHYRRIGWFKRVGGVIVAFHTYETDGGGIEFNWDSPTLDIDLAATLTTTRRTDAVKVPLNFSTIANLSVNIDDAANANYVWIYCPDQADLTPSITATPLANIATTAGFRPYQQIQVRTSAAGLIAAKANNGTLDLYKVVTLGFTWARRN